MRRSVGQAAARPTGAAAQPPRCPLPSCAPRRGRRCCVRVHASILGGVVEQTAAFISVQPWPQTGLLLGQATDASQAALAAFAAGPGAALAALPAAGAATAAVLASGSAAATAALNAAVAATAALPSALASGPAAAAAAFDAAVAAAAALPSALSPDAALPAAAAAAVAAAAALPAVLAPDVALPLAYDPATTARHFARRPLAVLARRASLLRELAGFGASLAADAASGRVEANAPERAATLRALIVGQGAALIKVGQAVAVRPDVLPPAYVEELAKLLDQVPPVEPLQARAALREALGALGTTAEQEFSDAATAFDSPVAAASIGQVYRATLMDGAEVAVKLQRPDILQSVSLDLHVLRSAALWLSRLPLRRQAAQGAALVEVLDVAGERFLAELDYEAEARNSVRFAALMAASESARGVVVTPAVVGRLSSRVILVQEWVSGTKLSDLPRTEENRARSEKAVRTLLLSYMVQLLETGFMHADPHPGNFLLLNDGSGRLAIIDYGMVTEIMPEQRIAFVEYMSHLSAGAFDETLDDLVNLGFVPPELAADPEKRAIVAPAVAATLSVLYSTGGGVTPDKVAQLRDQSRVAALSAELKALSRKYPLRLPPYFVLIIRAFGLLEGLGLSLNRSFSVLDECFPLVARRLLTDDSPRVRAALRTFVYGASDRLSVERVEAVAEGMRAFTTTMAVATPPPPPASAPAAALAAPAPSKPAPAPAAGLDPAAAELLGIVFAPGGSYVQTLLLEEVARSVDALSRDALVSTWAAAQRAAAPAAAPLSRALGPAAWLLPGFPLLAAAAAGPPIRLSEADASQLAVVRRLAQAVSLPTTAAGAAQPLDVAALVDVGRRVAPLLPALAPGLREAGERLLRLLAQRALARLSADLGLLAGALAVR